MKKNISDLEIKIQQVYHKGVDFNTIPENKTQGSVGYDLIAAIPEQINIAPGETVLVPTGIRLLFSNEKYFGLLAGRSGLSVKHKITLINGVGIIDPDYTGEIQVGLMNMSGENYTVRPADRIAQILFLPVEKPVLIPVADFDEDEHEEDKLNSRGDSGFGSTGR
jgi:dUTP pyrophosphatase